MFLIFINFIFEKKKAILEQEDKEEAKLLSSSISNAEEYEKATNVRTQCSMWSSTLDLRIKTQQVFINCECTLLTFFLFEN